MADKRVLLVGGTGKVGTAIDRMFKDGYTVIPKSSKDLDASDLTAVASAIKETRPDIVVNAVAYAGVEACEKDADMAYRLNTLLPKRLAEMSAEAGFTLVHFSSNAVFSDNEPGNYYTEDDCPRPINNYGLTKYGGDCHVRLAAKKYYLIRIPILFGETSKQTQFVEKMVQRIKSGQKKLRISNDIVANPSYNMDVAREVRRLIEGNLPHGLYHVCNEGLASLYDLMCEMAANLKLDAEIEGVPCSEFPSAATVNKYTPIKSSKIPFLRNWKVAAKEYCSNVRF